MFAGFRWLGRLEREVMDIVWRGGRVSVRDVQASLSRTVAYTTVMTTLDRLYKKGFVERERDGRAFLYRALQSHVEAARPLLSNLVDAVGERDAALLDELELLVKEKRKQLQDANRGNGNKEER
jgi:predicted transcriptional regulator